MQDVNPRRRLLGRVLIGAGALALPLTASISYAAQDAPDAPTPPEAPSAPDAPKVERHVTIIEHRRVDGDRAREIDDSKLHTRTITRDGKTIVIKTDHEISDADLEARLAHLHDLVPPVPPVPPVPGVAPRAPEAPRIERRVIVRHGDRHGPDVRVMSHDGRDGACAPGSEVADVDADDARDGQQRRVRVRLCSRGATPAVALTAIRRARDGIAADRHLSPEIRDKVLRELDAEIENLSKPG